MYKGGSQKACVLYESSCAPEQIQIQRKPYSTVYKMGSLVIRLFILREVHLGFNITKNGQIIIEVNLVKKKHYITLREGLKITH